MRNKVYITESVVHYRPHALIPRGARIGVRVRDG